MQLRHYQLHGLVDGRLQPVGVLAAGLRHGGLAAAAALEVEGVTGLAGGTMSEQLLGRKKLSKGITILWESDNITINVSIQIRYGGTIPEVARKVQEAIVTSVEDTSGLKVAAVNVRVGGVTFEKPEA